MTAPPRIADPRPLTQKARVRTGSILDLAVKFTKERILRSPFHRTLVWGSGSFGTVKPGYHHLKVSAVRGPLTRQPLGPSASRIMSLSATRSFCCRELLIVRTRNIAGASFPTSPNRAPLRSPIWHSTRLKSVRPRQIRTTGCRLENHWSADSGSSEITLKVSIERETAYRALSS